MMINFLRALSIVSPSVKAIPYIILLIVLSLVFLGVLLVFSSLRKYRRKRNLLIYSVMVLILVLIVIQAHDVALGPTLVSFGFDVSSNEFYPIKANQFNISSANSGLRTTSFYIVLKSVNASFVVENQQDYIQVNRTMVKIPFTFQELGRASESKPVFFTIDENVTSFLFKADIETQDSSTLLVGAVFWMNCTWNSTKTSYTIEPFSAMTA